MSRLRLPKRSARSAQMPADDMPITAHLVELRARLIKIGIAVGGMFVLLVGFSRQLYDGFSAPMVAQLPAHATMIATDVTSSFMAPIRLTLYVAALLAMPYVLYQVWAFVAPGLYQREKKIAIPVLFFSIVLFYGGVAFAYFVVLSGVLRFFIAFAPQHVLPMTDIDSYLDFALKLFMVFGITFEIPILTVLLVLMNVVTVATLADKRRYIVVGCFALAAIFSPPDAMSMLLLAVPMWLLFELGLVLARAIDRQAKQSQSAPSS